MNFYDWGRYGGHPAIVARFEQDTAEHELNVVHDDGLYRHLRFRNPKHSMYWFDIITWPGALTINGDMGTYTFARLEDMFQFFTHYVNATYWGEKLRAFSQNHGYQEYSERLFKQLVGERFAEWQTDRDPDAAAVAAASIAVEELLEHGDTAEQAYTALRDFEPVYGLSFEDAWEWDLRDYSLHYLWCCHAILWAVQEWRRQDTSQPAPIATAVSE